MTILSQGCVWGEKCNKTIDKLGFEVLGGILCVAIACIELVGGFNQLGAHARAHS